MSKIRKKVKSEIKSPEDPQARYNFEFKRLRDPHTIDLVRQVIANRAGQTRADVILVGARLDPLSRAELACPVRRRLLATMAMRDPGSGCWQCWWGQLIPVTHRG